jgi:hypothetical protein
VYSQANYPVAKRASLLWNQAGESSYPPAAGMLTKSPERQSAILRENTSEESKGITFAFDSSLRAKVQSSE